MKNINKILLTIATFFTFISISFFYVFAASTPALNTASTFGILSSTYTNTVLGTTINGDIGYTTPPAMLPALSGALHMVDSTYNEAGIHQNAALTNLNNQLCTYTFAPGAIDLSTDITHGPIGVYGSGVYCITGAASIGAGGITLDGSGTYIFKITGALTTVAGASVNVINGASACDVFWTPTQATTFGANTTFLGTIIADAGITMGENATLTGRALAFGGTITTDKNTINVPSCTIIPEVIPVVNNNNGGGGGSSTLKIDSCPDGDFSYSYYDGICGTAPIVVSTGVVIIESTGSIINIESTGSTINVESTGSTINVESTGTTLSVESTGTTINTQSTGTLITVPFIPETLAVIPTPTVNTNDDNEKLMASPGFPAAGMNIENNNKNFILLIGMILLISISLVFVYAKQKK